MATLIFKNKKLQEILKITERTTIFRATYAEAIDAYEKDTGMRYLNVGDLDKYYEHNIPTLWLVKDSGIYLMTSAKLNRIPKDKSHICYAEGFEPESPGSYDKCRIAVGGDDFVESFRFSDQLQKGIRTGADIQIDISAQSFVIQLVMYS